jgi:hypothetical protein
MTTEQQRRIWRVEKQRQAAKRDDGAIGTSNAVPIRWPGARRGWGAITRLYDYEIGWHPPEYDELYKMTHGHEAAT